MEQLTTSAGVQISYRDFGTGRPLIFMHGWLMSQRVWEYQAPLAETFRVIMPDLRGHGMSVGGEFSYDGCVADLQELIGFLGLEKAVVVGWSMGAQLALRLCKSLCHRIAGLVLVGGTPLFCSAEGYLHGVPPAEARSMALVLRKNFTRTAGDFFRGMFSAEELEHNDIAGLARTVVGRLPEPSVALAALDELVRTDLRGLLPEIDVPVLLMHGDADRICLPGAADYLRASLSDARLHVFTGSGHAPFLTRCAEFNTLLSAFAGEIYGAD
jgi:pimeloyl-[acyl-carrier protein] methyl ester esterase